MSEVPTQTTLEFWRIGGDYSKQFPRMALFVVGATRCGTTVLQNALNGCSEIYLFGEANLYRCSLNDNFRESYNKMHEGYGNQLTKSTYCPLVTSAPKWSDCLIELSKYYKYVGEKIAFGPGQSQGDFLRFIDFHAEVFLDSWYLFVFRRPNDAIMSASALFPAASFKKIAMNYVNTLRTYVVMRRIFKRVIVINSDHVSPETFRCLGGVLGLDLYNGHKYYIDAAKTHYDSFPRGSKESAIVERINRIYEILLDITGVDHLDQLEQKKTGPTKGVTTVLGEVDREINSLEAIMMTDATERRPDAPAGQRGEPQTDSDPVPLTTIGFPSDPRFQRDDEAT